MNRNYIYLAIALLLILIGALAIRTTIDLTAYAVKEPAYVIGSESELVIERSELRLCCELVAYGEKKGCWALHDHSCSYCEKLCLI